MGPLYYKLGLCMGTYRRAINWWCIGCNILPMCGSLASYQITIAHVIANPKPELFKKTSLEEKGRNAIGILTITPGEGTIIAADIASKAAGIEIGFVDRFSGALLITGDVSAVESFLRSVIEGLERILGFYPTELTRT